MSLKIKLALIPLLAFTQYCSPKTQNTAASKAPAAESGQAQGTSAQLAQVVTPYHICLEHIEDTVGTDCLRLQIKLNNHRDKNSDDYKALTKLFNACHEDLELKRRLCNNAYLDFQNSPNPPDFDNSGDPMAYVTDCPKKATASRADCTSQAKSDFDLKRCQEAYEKDVHNCYENYMRSISPNTAGTGYPSVPTPTPAPISPQMPSTKPTGTPMPSPMPTGTTMPSTKPTGTTMPSTKPIVP